MYTLNNSVDLDQKPADPDRHYILYKMCKEHSGSVVECKMTGDRDVAGLNLTGGTALIVHVLE